MTVGELKSALSGIDDSFDVGICVKEPDGFMCPDGCVAGVKRVAKGMDMHADELLIVPYDELAIVKFRELSEKPLT